MHVIAINVSIFYIWHHRFKSTFQSTQHLIEEVESAIILYEEMKEEFPVVLCHLDCRIENIIYNLKNGMCFGTVIFKVLDNAKTVPHSKKVYWQLRQIRWLEFPTI